MKRFAGRHAVVTGASRGIGAALSERLAAEGADLVLVARTVDHHDHLTGSLSETVEHCRRHGVRAELVAADLTDETSRAGIIPAALEHLDGRIDILVNNAAAAIYQPVLESTLKRRRLMLEVNVNAPIELAQAVVPSMRERGEGWIVNVSSATARPRLGPPFPTGGVATEVGMYGASKAALNRVTNAIAIETFADGIRVNTVEPRAAVMSEGAEALVGGTVSEADIESMEAMVEAILVLCDCERERTGVSFVSLDLLDELGVEVRTLDGSRPYEGGQRVARRRM